MKVLVTGATGFTGGHLARALKRRGHDVRAMVRSSTRSGQVPDLERDGITLVAGDLADPASLPAAVDHGVEVIYNIAALYRTAGLPASGICCLPVHSSQNRRSG